VHREYVLASGNPGKLREISEMFRPLGVVVRPQSDWQVPDADENAGTFVENALIKARQAISLTGLPAIADDSGLVVPALNGEPGIYSARYSGADADAQSNMAKLLLKLQDQTGASRNAHFFCAMVLVKALDDPAPLIAIGRWHGTILPSPQGQGGFGYDPVFGLLEPQGSDRQISAAELVPEDKARLSHRGKALRELFRQMTTQDDGVIE
jgi:XTP/dITP diphosphohydrolase